MIHPAALALFTSALMSGITSGTAAPGHAGQVIAAPHDGYDLYSGTIAKQVANRLNYGWVKATGYRSIPYHYWYDVNRPTERTYQGRSGFGTEHWTSASQRIYDEYQRKLRRAARITSGKIDFLVEIHGNARSVNAGGRNLRIQQIELATVGFTSSQLRRIKSRYQTLLRSIPTRLRVDLAIDDLDSRYVYEGWYIPFYWYASGAKSTGSLRTSQVRRALHFEMSPRARSTASARSYYVRLLADLVEYARKL